MNNQAKLLTETGLDLQAVEKLTANGKETFPSVVVEDLLGMLKDRDTEIKRQKEFIDMGARAIDAKEKALDERDKLKARIAELEDACLKLEGEEVVKVSEHIEVVDERDQLRAALDSAPEPGTKAHYQYEDWYNRTRGEKGLKQRLNEVKKSIKNRPEWLK